VTAGVEEGSQGPVLAADEQDGDAGDVERPVRPGGRKVAAQADDERVTAEERPDLVAEAIRVGVAGRRLAADGLREGGRPPVTQFEETLEEPPLHVDVHRLLLRVRSS
jgi:hypothetical protein